MHARAALERSLAHDQANLPARLRLGAVLRLLGDNAESADQLDLLLDDLRRKDELPTLARDLVEHHPAARVPRAVRAQHRARQGRAIASGKRGPGSDSSVKELESRRDDPALRQLYPVALAAWGAAHLGIGQDEMSRQAVLRRLDDIAQRLEASCRQWRSARKPWRSWRTLAHGCSSGSGGSTMRAAPPIARSPSHRT